jgi:hypothetical protein
MTGTFSPRVQLRHPCGLEEILGTVSLAASIPGNHPVLAREEHLPPGLEEQLGGVAASGISLRAGAPLHHYLRSTAPKAGWIRWKYRLRPPITGSPPVCTSLPGDCRNARHRHGGDVRQMLDLAHGGLPDLPDRQGAARPSCHFWVGLLQDTLPGQAAASSSPPRGGCCACGAHPACSGSSKNAGLVHHAKIILESPRYLAPSTNGRRDLRIQNKRSGSTSAICWRPIPTQMELPANARLPQTSEPCLVYGTIFFDAPTWKPYGESPQHADRCAPPFPG